VSQPEPSTERAAKGFFGYAPDLEEEVRDFQRAAYPQRAPDSILPNWRWMFVEPARRLGVEPFVWMYRRAHAVVAHQGAIPVRLKLGDETLTTGWFVETMAAEAVRGSAMGPMRIRKALEDLPFNLSLGQTEQMRELQFAMGWRHVRDLSTYLYVVGFTMSLRNKLPPLVAELAAAGLGAWQRLLLAWRRLRCARAGTVAEVSRFATAHDALWLRMAAELDCAVIRDAAYLNWKYVDRPGADFVRLELRRGASVDGVAVLALRAPDAVYRYRRAVLVDLVVVPSDAAAVTTVG